MLNRVFLQGRLVADPELKHTQNGVAVATFRLAVDRDFKPKDPNAQDCDFVQIIAWRSTAEFLMRHFHKGSMIIVGGSLQLRQYIDRDGNKKTATEVIASNVWFGEGKKNNQRQPKPEMNELEEDDGDLPW